MICHMSTHIGVLQVQDNCYTTSLPNVTPPLSLGFIPPSNPSPLRQVLTDRTKDESDLVARCLPLLKGTNPLDAWGQVLGNEEALKHPRSVGGARPPDKRR